jgi:DNA-binding transcriptional regulator YiaG
MTHDLHALLRKSGMSKASLARFLGHDHRTVRRWFEPEDCVSFREISPSALLWLRLAAERPDLFDQAKAHLAA